MKFKLIALLLAIASLFLFLSLVACEEESNDDEWKNDMYLVLVNKTNTVGADHIPNNLVDVDKKYVAAHKKDTIQLEKTTAEAVALMIDAMKADGIDNVTVTSAYRTYEYQEFLFNKYIAQEKADHPTWSDAEARDFVLTYSAYPGTSEHQTGLCVDLWTTEMEPGLYNYGSETPNNPYDKGFAETEAFVWLQKNAHKYGFILRFPEDKTEITGYSYESWHYRYVGIEHATKIYEKGITLEEYLGK
ncbi:MAG: D-alanyl-D-alanine carboxypeptidase family protein [Ruminococcaceae bacterium]|nr:D-alanyl-D-alanine carboxypeptidase family protein [Oscillospiraceae bacterium]